MNNETVKNQSLAHATAETLKKYGLYLKKGYGQNFLVNEAVPERIIEGAGITKEDSVLEIGPGIGTLTMYLARAAGYVTAVEIDKRLIPVLKDTLMTTENVRVVQGDILKTDIAALCGESGGKPFKVVANLPYYITTPIIMSLLEGEAPYKSIIVMVQKEVAARIIAEPGTKDYGMLTAAAGYYTRASIITEVSPESFIPRPKVSSAVIKLEKREEPPVMVRDKKLFFKVLRAAFNQRRKTLLNALANSPELEYDKAQILEAIKGAGLDEKTRGEKLDLHEFAAVANSLLEK